MLNATMTAGRSRTLAVLALAVAFIMAGTLALWASYGTAVFFEILRTGWAMCF